MRYSAEALGLRMGAEWVATPRLAGDAAGVLRNYDGIVIAPGSPYRSMEGAIDAIRVRAHATLAPDRQLRRLPTYSVRVCTEGNRAGGCGIGRAWRAIRAPDRHSGLVSDIVRTQGQPNLHGPAIIRIRRGTRAWEAYGRDKVSEQHFCNYEVNPAYREELEAAGLVLSGWSEQGDIRMVELPGHPCFLATLFQPQLTSQPGNPHPLLTALVRASSRKNCAAAGA